MQHQLLLLRHAKSDWETDAATDFERPLAKRGRKAAPRIGEWLKSQGLTPDCIISSPAERARQTTFAVAKVLGIEKDTVQWEAQVYEATLDGLLAVIKNCPESLHRVMLVGHNPGLEELLEWCCDPELPGLQRVKVLPTAAVAVLALTSPWAQLTQGSATLLDLMRPRELKRRTLL